MEQVIEIKKKNALKALKGAKGEIRQRLTDLLGGEVTNQDPMEFENYAEICEAEDIDPLFKPFPSPQSKKEACLNGAFKLLTIFEAFNNRCGENFDESWEADYTDSNQKKHYPWGEYNPSLSAFVCSGTDYADTDTYLGARLCTNTDTKAKRIAMQFRAEWNEFLNPQI